MDVAAVDVIVVVGGVVAIVVLDLGDALWLLLILSQSPNDYLQWSEALQICSL